MTAQQQNTLKGICQELQEIDPNGTWYDMINDITDGITSLDIETNYTIGLISEWLSEGAEDYAMVNHLNSIIDRLEGLLDG